MGESVPQSVVHTSSVSQVWGFSLQAGNSLANYLISSRKKSSPHLQPGATNGELDMISKCLSRKRKASKEHSCFFSHFLNIKISHVCFPRDFHWCRNMVQNTIVLHWKYYFQGSTTDLGVWLIFPTNLNKRKSFAHLTKHQYNSGKSLKA